MGVHDPLEAEPPPLQLLTLLGLVIGEKLIGIPGMILAPAVLHYVKVEASRDRIPAD